MLRSSCTSRPLQESCVEPQHDKDADACRQENEIEHRRPLEFPVGKMPLEGVRNPFRLHVPGIRIP